MQTALKYSDVDADALAANLAENNFNAQTINEIMEAKDASGETIGYALNRYRLLKDMAETSSSPWEFRMTEP